MSATTVHSPEHPTAAKPPSHATATTTTPPTLDTGANSPSHDPTVNGYDNGENSPDHHDNVREATEEEESAKVVEVALSSSSLLKIQKGDITRWSVDTASHTAIVNAANERMLGGSGVDGAIHRAAGPELREACYEVPEVDPGVRCPTGEARITLGFRLPASHVIHTVGPIYDLDENPEVLLQSAYRNTLQVAKENSIQYIAFPAISCGVYAYPYDEAASIAISTVKEFAKDFKEVHFVLFSDDIYDAWLEKAKELLENRASSPLLGTS